MFCVGILAREHYWKKLLLTMFAERKFVILFSNPTKPTIIHFYKQFNEVLY